MRTALLLLMLLLVPTAAHVQTPRFVYLSPIDGSGTDADPYHSRCWDLPGSGNIDLRPWGINRWVCASDALPNDSTGVERLGDALDERLTVGRKATLDTLARKTLQASTVNGAIAELLQPKLRPGRDGKVKIYLGTPTPIYQRTAWVPFEDGGLIADATNAISALLEPPMAWATTLATETFTATDGNLDGCQARGCTHTWVEFFGTDPTVASNVAIGTVTGANINEARLDSDLATDDMEVSATITAMSYGTEVRCGVISRKDSSSTRTFYIAQATFNGSTDNWRLAKRVAGSFTSLSSTGTPAVSDTVRLRSDGTSHSVYVNDSLLIGPTTDADISGNTRVGLTFAGNASGDSCSLDNIVAYDYPLTMSGPSRRRF